MKLRDIANFALAIVSLCVILYGGWRGFHPHPFWVQVEHPLIPSFIVMGIGALGMLTWFAGELIDQRA